MAEAATGIIVMPSGERMINQCPVERFQVFPSQPAALAFCEAQLAVNLSFEYMLFGTAGQYLETLRRFQPPVLTSKRSLWKKLFRR